MHALHNLVTGRSYDFLGSTGDWTVNSTHQILSTRERIKYDELGSLKVIASSSTDVVLTSPASSIRDQWGWPARAFVWVYSPQSVSVTVTVITTLTSSSTASEITNVKPNIWTLCSVTGTTVLEGSAVQMTVTLDGLVTNDVVYITNPGVLAPNAISRSIFAAEVYARIPEYLREADDVQENPDHPLLRFIDVLTSEANEIFALWDTYRYIPPEQGGEDQEPSLLDPSVADLPTLRWLAQILNVRLYNSSSGATSWHSLETLLNPGGEPTWDHWETVPDPAGTVLGTADTEWDEIEEFSPDLVGLLDAIRWQVQTAYFGIRGGTREAILETVKYGLTGTKTATFFPHHGGDPWAFRVETLQSETPDTPSLGDPSVTIQELVANAVPAGFEFVHETVAG